MRNYSSVFPSTNKEIRVLPVFQQTKQGPSSLGLHAFTLCTCASLEFCRVPKPVLVATESLEKGLPELPARCTQESEGALWSDSLLSGAGTWRAVFLPALAGAMKSSSYRHMDSIAWFHAAGRSKRP